MTRQRETLRCVSPTRWYSPFSSTRSSFACSSSGNSPISSSSRVPSWASSKYPALLEAAPVNAPLTYPNRVGSTSVGEIAAQLRVRSEEHTSELQSPCNLVCRLLLEKKKKQIYRVDCDQQHKMLH